jgi:hypothetical protein
MVSQSLLQKILTLPSRRNHWRAWPKPRILELFLLIYFPSVSSIFNFHSLISKLHVFSVKHIPYVLLFVLHGCLFIVLLYYRAWVPGASFQIKAREWRGYVTQMTDAPFETVVKAMVGVNYLTSLHIFFKHLFIENWPSSRVFHV